MAEQIGRDNGVVLGQLVDHGTPCVGTVADAVDEEYRRSGSRMDEGPSIPVDGAELDGVIALVPLAGPEPDQCGVDRLVRGFGCVRGFGWVRGFDWVRGFHCRGHCRGFLILRWTRHALSRIMHLTSKPTEPRYPPRVRDVNCEFPPWDPPGSSRNGNISLLRLVRISGYRAQNRSSGGGRDPGGDVTQAAM